MIDKDSIETKDFSIELPDLMAKIQFIGSSFINAAYEKGFVPSDEFLHGSGLILNEVFRDLKLINKALYPGSKVV